MTVRDRLADASGFTRVLIGYLLLSAIALGVFSALCASTGAGMAYDLRYWFGWTPFTFAQAAAIGAVGGAVIWAPAALLVPGVLYGSERDGGDLVVTLTLLLGVFSLPLVGAAGAGILGYDLATATAFFSITPVALLGSVLAIAALCGVIYGIHCFMTYEPSRPSLEMRETYQYQPQLRAESSSKNSVVSSLGRPGDRQQYNNQSKARHSNWGH